MICHHCGKDIDESLFRSPLNYCPHCGQNLKASIGDRATEDIPFCPYCGKELSSRVNFCPYCDQELARRIAPYHEKHEDRKLTEQRAKPVIDKPGQKRKEDKLYKQWMKYANLPSEATPATETPRDTPVRRERKGTRLTVLYMLLGVCIVVLCVGLVLLLMQSC